VKSFLWLVVEEWSLWRAMFGVGTISVLRVPTIPASPTSCLRNSTSACSSSRFFVLIDA
jgi:hypothetical protein